MTFLDLAQQRYTTKKYRAGAKVSDVQLQQLKDILRLSPSSINSQPWKFVFVDDVLLKGQLAAASYFNDSKVNDASHLVVFLVQDDVQKFEAQIPHYLPESSVAYYKKYIQPLPEAEIKAWMKHQVYLSLGFFLSACAAMEIDSTSLEGIEKDKYDALLQIEGYKVAFAVAIGYRDPEDANQPSVRGKLRLPAVQILETR